MAANQTRSEQKARYVADDMMMLSSDLASLRNMLPKAHGHLRERLERLSQTLNEESEALYAYARETARAARGGQG